MIARCSALCRHRRPNQDMRLCFSCIFGSQTSTSLQHWVAGPKVLHHEGGEFDLIWDIPLSMSARVLPTKTYSHKYSREDGAYQSQTDH